MTPADRLRVIAVAGATILTELDALANERVELDPLAEQFVSGIILDATRLADKLDASALIGP